MRNFALVFALFVNLLLAAQTPVVIDTLNAEQKTALKEEYKLHKESFLKNLQIDGSKKELKQIKEIFNNHFDDFEKIIDKNCIVSQSPFNQYLIKLFEEIRAQNSEIPSDVKLLVSRAFAENAAVSGDGLFQFNQSLLKCIDNEDQLVYIICHEMAHRVLNHSITGMLAYLRKDSSKELKNNVKEIKRQQYGKQTDAENLLKELAYASSRTNRYNEMQADSLGYIFYVKLSKNRQQPVAVMEKMRDSDNERDSLTINDYQKLFADASLNFNEKWFDMGDYGKYHYRESTKFNTDSLRTHPNMNQRIEMLEKEFPQYLDSADNAPVTVSAEFTKWKENVDYQAVYNLFAGEKYGSSLYEALKLYNRQPLPFLKEYISKSFEKLAEAKQKYRLNRYVSQVNVHEYTDSYNLFCTFINNLTVNELKTFAEYFTKK
ncbi:MAG: M48 family metalloprotease [Paludibacter sp.]|nr:M48 family metalloprotease [Paludibacter sp.]